MSQEMKEQNIRSVARLISVIILAAVYSWAPSAMGAALIGTAGEAVFSWLFVAIKTAKSKPHA